MDVSSVTDSKNFIAPLLIISNISELLYVVIIIRYFICQFHKIAVIIYIFLNVMHIFTKKFYM